MAKSEISFKSFNVCADFHPKFSDSKCIHCIPAKQGQYPWQVAVTNYYTGLICGGTLISPKYVLTAAHCAHRWNGPHELGYRIKLGDIDRTKGTSRKGNKNNFLNIFKYI